MGAGDSVVQCRICLAEGPRTKMASPCFCSGSAAFVHPRCQLKWVKESGRDNCEICGQEFLFKTRRRTACSQDVWFTCVVENWKIVTCLTILLVWFIFSIPVCYQCIKEGILITEKVPTPNGQVVCSLAYSIILVILFVTVLLLFVGVGRLMRISNNAIRGNRKRVGLYDSDRSEVIELNEQTTEL